jgi:hypothetical protein
MKFSNTIKIGILTLCLAFASVSISAPVFAQTNGEGGTGGSGVNSTGGGTSGASQKTAYFTLTNPLHANSIGEVVLDFVQIFSYIVILLAVLMLIYVGFQYILASAQGDSGKIKDLHGYLLWIVVGIAVVIGARVIVQVVINTLSATGTVSPTIINSANKALK